MAHRPKITPEVLKWARLRARLSEEELAKRSGFSRTESYQAVESGRKRPTQNQLRKLAKALERPLFFFFLNEPPDEPEPLANFRLRLYHEEAVTHQEIAAIREAMRRRDLALDAAEGLRVEIPRMLTRSSVANNPEEVAAETRARLGVPLLDQLKWSHEEAYRQWRVAVEQAGVLVFHFRLENRSGFAMALDILPIIGISTAEEWNTARQFTLMHELGHIILGDSTIHSDTSFYAYGSPEEIWCNRFAAAVLVPREALVGLDITQQYGEHGLWGEEDVREVARLFKVSPSVLVRRLDRFNLIHSDVADHLRSTFDDYTPEARQKEKGGPTFYTKELSSWGYYVPDILFQSYREGVSDLADLAMALRASPVMVEKYEQYLSRRNLTAIS